MRCKLFMLIVLVILISLVLGGCTILGFGEPEISPDEIVQTMVAETMVVEHSVQTIVASTLIVEEEVAPEEPSPTDVPEPDPVITEPIVETLQPTLTLTPTITMTPTPDVAMVSVSVSTNCRLGPGPDYGIVGALVVGQEAEVVGVAEDGQYWVIKNPTRAGECWLWGHHASVVGPTEELPRRTPPPTPTPSPTLTPTVTPTPAYNWTDSWNTMQQVAGVTFSHLLILTQNNGVVTGEFSDGISTILLSGTLSSDKTQLTGTFVDGVDTFTFTLRLINNNQFIGNIEGFVAWCGHRAGAGMPSPCMGP